MKRRTCTILTLILITATAIAVSGSPVGTIYVSPGGNDAWSGSFPSPNANRTDGPVATLERARDLARAARRKGATAAISIRGGAYDRSQTFVLTSADSGSTSSPLRIAAYHGEKVTVRGSASLTGWRSLEDPGLLTRIHQNARGHVIVTVLSDNKISNVPQFVPRGGPPIELFAGGKRMPLARYPNRGWLHIADVPQHGDSLFNEGLARERRFDNVPVGRHYGRIKYAEERPSAWSSDNDITLQGFWTWDWSDSYQRVESINPTLKEITLATPHHHYGYTRNQRFAVLNVLEELDEPGEWVLDRGRDCIYFWPPAGTAKDVRLSILDQPLLRIERSSNIVISGITFEQSRGNGVVLTSVDSVVVAGCTLRLLGMDAALIEGGTRSGLLSCTIEDVAMGGITLGGGDRLTLVPGGNFAVNNHIHHYSNWLRTGQYAVRISGVGNRIANNLIHDAPFEAIYVTGNEHLIEYNEVHHVCLESGDAGALHTGRDWTWRGNVIRYNYWHHLLGPGLHGVMGVYLDDWGSDFTVYGNLFYKAGRATLVGGGRNNIVQNNIYLECTPSIHLDARGLGWASYYFEGFKDLTDKMAAVHADRPPYTTRYPELVTLYQDEPAVPKYNRITNNVSQGGRWLDVHDYPAFDLSVMTIEGNLVADTALFRHRNRTEKGWDPYYLNIDWIEGFTTHRSPDSLVVSQFPRDTFLPASTQVVVLKNGRPVLPDHSPAYAKGFTRIPTERIGLYRDRYRQKLPPEGTR